MMSLAGADGVIGCWTDKAYWSFWRPITAIQLADTDGNPATEADPHWTSLVPSPPYPDHPSGFNCVTAAMLYAAQGFFGHDVAFTVHSNATNADRSYQRLTDPVKDTIEARMLLGIHFRAPDVQGAGLGKQVARWLLRFYFKPVT